MLLAKMSQRSDYWSKFKNYGDFISSTQVAAIFHGSSFMSKKKLYNVLKGKEKRPHYENDAMRYGKDMEDKTLMKALGFLKGKGLIDEQKGTVHRCGTIVHPLKNVCCSPDSVYVEEKKSIVGIEVKTCYTKKCPQKVEDLPLQYLLQCFVSIYVTEADRWYLYYHDHMVGEYSCYVVGRNNDLWEHVLEGIEEFRNCKTEPGRKNPRDKMNAEWLRDRLIMETTKSS